MPLTGEIRQLVTATPDYFARHGIPETPDDLLSHQGIGMRMAHGGIYRWELARRGNVRPCRTTALCDVRSFCLNPRRKGGIRGRIFAGTVYSGRAEKRGAGERLKRLGAAVCRAAPVLPRPSPRPAGVAGAGGDDPRARDYSRLALFSPYAASSEPGSMREVMPRRFQALIATMAKFSSEISTSEKCSATLRYSASLTP